MNQSTIRNMTDKELAKLASIIDFKNRANYEEALVVIVEIISRFIEENI